MVHHPLVSHGNYSGYTQVKPFWDKLYAAHADLVLVGHDHNYQRFVLMNHLGRPDPAGFREFVIGTGGSNYGPTITPTVPITSAALKFKVFGVAEFLYVSKEQIERTLMGFEIMAFVWIAYTIVCYPLTAVGRRVENRLRARGQSSLAGAGA